jgi:hypothetical protein
MNLIAMFLTTLALTTAEVSVTPVAVAVVAPRDVTDSMVRSICAEAEAIWAPAGIVFEWTRDGAKDDAHRLKIEVTVDDRHAPVGRDGALGWLRFTDDHPDRAIHLSRAAAEGLLRDSPGLTDGTITSHEAFISRALGRALAHEFGHYILRSKAHTPRGLMRAAWTSSQTFAINRDGFVLTAQERATAAGYLWTELTCCGRAPGVASW